MLGLQTRSLLTALGVTLCLTVIGAAPCLAQLNGGGAGDIGAAARRNLRNPGAAAKPEPAPPPVLPGTKPAADPASPTLSPADMSPTDALFDSINRGDLAAARDAMNRGANLDATNLLGLTPLDLAIDLGRNEISHLLLLFRSEDGPSASQPPRGGSAAAGGDAGGAREGRAATRRRPPG